MPAASNGPSCTNEARHRRRPAGCRVFVVLGKGPLPRLLETRRRRIRWAREKVSLPIHRPGARITDQ